MFNPDFAFTIDHILAFLGRLRKHSLKLSPAKAQQYANEGGFREDIISPAGGSPNAEKDAAVANMPVLKNIEEYSVHSLEILTSTTRFW